MLGGRSHHRWAKHLLGVLFVLSCSSCLASGCLCWGDIGCYDGASIETTVSSAGPLVATLCVNGACSEPVTLTQGEGSTAVTFPADPNIIASARARGAGVASSRVSLEIDFLGDVAPRDPDSYRLVIEDSSGVLVDRAMAIQYAGYNPNGDFCTDAVCYRGSWRF